MLWVYSPPYINYARLKAVSLIYQMTVNSVGIVEVPDLQPAEVEGVVLCEVVESV